MAGSTALKPGQRLSGPLKKLSRERILTHSGGPLGNPGWPRRGYHTADDVARTAGFSSMLVSGTMNEGYILQLMVETFGERWFDGGKLDLRFVKPVYEGDEIRAHATVRGPEDGADGAGVTLDVWCENQRGEKVVVGVASIRAA